MKIKPQKVPFSGSSNFFLKFCMLFVCFLIVSTTSIYAQSKTITGTVVDTNKEPLIGVTVKIPGTSVGTVTDIDGTYSLSISGTDKLEFSFVGMKSQIITVGAQNVINITLEDDAQMLTETVVIGYGSAKAKDLTSPIATIKGDEINKHLTASPMQGLQGKISGLQVVNSGQPGSSPKVRIRGVGNYDAEKQGPLYVVDGMFFDNIDFLSNNDIENISVLKDASSSAIYGVRAANGVVIVTTKKGVTNRKPEIVYDGYVGFQKATNVPKMANSAQYATLMNEIGTTTSITQSINKYGGSNGMPSTNTDWYNELLRTAMMHSHSVSATGGGEKTTYSLGVSYLNQEGIMDTDNGYERINVRTRVDAGLTDWLRIGGNMILVNSNQQIANKSAFTSAYTSPTIYPIYDNDNTGAFPKKYASAQNVSLSSYFANPIAKADYYNESQRITQVLPTFYAELSFLDSKLTVKSSFNQDISFTRYRKFLPTYYVSSDQQNKVSSLVKRNKYNNNWLWDNVATYRDSFGKHSLTAMAGNSIRKERYEMLMAEGTNIPEGQDEYWYIHNGNQSISQNKDGDSSTWPDDGAEYRGASFFGRVMYDYAGKYLLSATFRADGSSKYQEKWGYFPSVGLGWIATEENFLKNQKAINFLKLRASWGKLGNDKIQANDGFASITSQTAIFNDVTNGGYTSLSYFSKLKWEVVEELDFGFDLTTLNNRLDIELDYYNRTTKNAVFSRTLPFSSVSLLMNNGEIQNRGLEVSLNWNDKIGKDFSYNIGLNMSTLKNKVTYLDGLQSIVTSGDYNTIRRVGETVDSYYGYEVAGVYQNQAEIDNDPTVASVASSLKPGDFKYRDLDGDGKLTDADRTVLGSPIPKFFLGGNIGFAYKAFDFSTSFQGSFGHKILNLKRLNRQKQTDINYDLNLVENRWTGEGSTNKYPSAAGMVNTWNYKFNSFFVENANTFTIQNIQLGYTIPNLTIAGGNKSALRLSVTAERPFNFFSYNGFTTDISNGIDNEIYPLAATYSFGVKLTY